MVLKWLILFILIVSQCACVSGIWTGASLAYDRNSVYNTLNDYNILRKVHDVLYQDNVLKQPGCNVELVVFNRDILLAGYVRSARIKNIVITRTRRISGYRTLYNQLSVEKSNDSTPIMDDWITAKIRSGIFADSDIPPKLFKIVTVDGIVYIMGDVLVEHAEKVITIARETSGVKKVVTLIKYYKLAAR